jgi:hypothetical protein
MNKIGMFGLVLAVAITGTATMSSFVVSADARPTDSGYCAKNVPPSNVVTVCGFTTKENCEAYADAVSGRQVCTPAHRTPA